MELVNLTTTAFTHWNEDDEILQVIYQHIKVKK